VNIGRKANRKIKLPANYGSMWKYFPQKTATLKFESIEILMNGKLDY
jgi:hypothetical protein